MIPLLSRQQSLELDRETQRRYGIEGTQLMESAGALSAHFIRQKFSFHLRQGFLHILCGPGHNGADAMVVARHLWTGGHRRLLVHCKRSSSPSSLYTHQIDTLKALGVPLKPIGKSTLKSVKPEHLIVDGLYGVGLDRELSSLDLLLVRHLFGIQATVVSLDVPSGLCSDSGRVLGGCVKASFTLTFGAPKVGMLVGDGPVYCGKIHVLPIGFPRSLVKEVAETYRMITKKKVQSLLPNRNVRSNKSHFGRVLVLAGRDGFWGAGLLSTQAAFRMGAGYVTWSSFDNVLQVLAKEPEALTLSIEEALSDINKFNGILVGPGLGADEKTKHLVERLIEMKAAKVVLDADALTVLSQMKIKSLPTQWVLTPHAGEMGRLMNVPADEVERHRTLWVSRAAKRFGCWILLKGHHSLLSFKERVFVVPTGNQALAKAGTGDVLGGMMVSLMAQGLSSGAAAASSSFLHGWMADQWVQEGKSPRSLVASDLKDSFALALSYFEQQSRDKCER